MEISATAQASGESQAPAQADGGTTPGSQPLWHVGVRALRKQGKRIRDYIAPVSVGSDAEDIHQMRVATRRLRTMARVLEETPAFRRRRVARLRKQLQPLAKRLGAVRDLDILVQHLDAYERETSNVSPALRDALERRREKALEEVCDELRRPALRRRLRHLRRTTRRLVAHDEDARQIRMRNVAGEALRQRYEAVLNFQATIEEGACVRHLHALRIACKQLRYALELFCAEDDPRGQVLIGTLKEAQDYLGDLQDSVFAVSLLSRLGHDLPHDEALAGFLATQEAQQERLRQGFAPLWARLSGSAFRQNLAAFIAAL